MSLIQEALRRQQEDGGKGKPDGAAAAQPPARSMKGATSAVPTPAIPPRPAVPPPAPPPVPATPTTPQEPEAAPAEEAGESTPAEEEASSRQRPVLIGVLVGVVLLLVATVLIGRFAVQRLRAKVREPRAAAARQLLTNAAAQVSSAPGAPAATSTPAAAAQTAATPPAPASSTVAVAAAPPPPVVPVETANPVIQWPALTLKAVIDRGGGKGVAFINGKPFQIAEQVEGATILSFGDQCVHLEYKGEKRTLRIGGTLQ